MARRARRRARQQARYDRGGGLGRRGIMPRIFPGKNYRYEEEEREEERMPPVIREARPGEGRGGPALIYEIPFVFEVASIALTGDRLLIAFWITI